MKQYVIFRKSKAHCSIHLLKAYSVIEAMRQYAIAYIRCEWKNGLLTTLDGYGNTITYSHPLECIEAEEKIRDIWDIVEVNSRQWEADYAPILCSSNPYDVEDYKDIALPLFREEYPNVEVDAFAWSVDGGFLVTFYKKISAEAMLVKIVARYHITTPWPTVSKWEGYNGPENLDTKIGGNTLDQ